MLRGPARTGTGWATAAMAEAEEPAGTGAGCPAVGPVWTVDGVPEGASGVAESRGATARGSAGCCGTSRIGTMSVKTLPSPGTLCTVRVPPRRCARSRDIDRPSPVPPYLRWVLPSAWRKASKIRACWWGGMPMPVSFTANDSVSSGLRDTCSATAPLSVNLSALDSRFLSTWPRRCGSVSKPAGVSGATVVVSSRPFSCATGRNGSTSACSVRAMLTGSTSTVACPDSIFARSRMSLISASRSLPAA